MSAIASPTFRLTTLRGHRRVLLIVAPDGEGDRLARQRDAIREALIGAEDRDLTVIEIAGPDGSILQSAAATPQPLDASTVAQVRAERGLDDDAFVVLLIGKDGGEKLRRDEPVSMDEVFELIDSMPMRQAEIRTRR